MVLLPGMSWACACGCGIFEVGTASLYPHGSGGTVWLEYDFLDQNTNWHEAHKAPAIDNDDKALRTHFFTLGAQYMFNRDWGVMFELPYTDRYFKTTADDGSIQSFEHSAIGDVRIEGMYTGFSEDMSSGLRFGLKLASGDFTYQGFDRDTSIGSGSTDLLLGGYHVGALPLEYQGRPFNWFAQIQLQLPMWTQQQYHPGNEINGAVGALYDFGAVGIFDELAPVLNLAAGDRTRDNGANADHDNSGYDRVLLGPGIEVKVGIIRLYADVRFPVYQNVVGNQLTTPVYVKFVASYDF
ncbi:MAG TPA: hypothetical protein VMT89_14475 [Candidatus Acidoferrales bacterium]|nr:hypothetical protein [Candidatus Acidoferrales bacterium]